MTMTISEALCRMAKLVHTKGESFEDAQAWDVIRSRLEVSEEMVRRATKAALDSASSSKVAMVDGSSLVSFRFDMKAALVAALGE